MANTPAWIEKAAKKWGDQILKEDLGRYRLAELAGISTYKARTLIDFVKAQGVSLDEDSEEDEEDEVPVPKGKDLDAHDLLYHDNYVYNKATDTYITFTRVTAPKPIVMDGEKHRSLIKAYSNWDGKPATINQICREFQIPRPWLIEYLRIYGVTHDSEPFSREEVETRDIEDMVEEALQFRRQSLYRKYEMGKWKDIQDAAEKWMAFDKTVLERFERAIQNHSVSSQSVPPLKLREAPNPYALVISPTDFHWGMYSWEGESNDPYDFDTAKDRLIRHTEKVVARLPGRPETIYVAIGSDWFHVDGTTNHTTKGTPQDIAGTPSEILVTGCKLTQAYIELLRQVAPVEIYFMPGNHDQHNSRALMLYLAAWYRQTSDVLVYEEYHPRVYAQYGSSLIGFHHGDTTKVKDLGACMAKEARTMWGDTEWHLWFGGHLHTHHVQEAGGIIHYQLPSLAGLDRWHAAHGYVDSDPSLVAYLIDRQDGPVSWVRSAETTPPRPVRKR